MLIPTPGTHLLLPNVCIAEIVPWRRIKMLPNGPSWCMGHVDWRGRIVPVVHYASFADTNVPAPTTARCLVIMNRARNPRGPAFYALAAVGLPRMMQLLEDDLQNNNADLGAADVMQVRVGTEDAVIPSLEYIEGRLADLASIEI